MSEARATSSEDATGGRMINGTQTAAGEFRLDTSFGNSVKISLLLFAATSIHAVVSQRAFFADGVGFFYDILIRRDFSTFDNARQYAHYLLQAPLVCALTWFKVADVRLLAYVFGASYFIHPVVSLFVCWLIVKRHQPGLILYPLISAIFVYANTGCFIVSEAHLASSFFWPQVCFLLTTNRLNWKTTVLPSLAALLSIRMYEGYFICSALLVIIAINQIRESKAARHSIGAALLYIVINILGFTYQIANSIVPRDVANRDAIFRYLPSSFAPDNLLFVLTTFLLLLFVLYSIRERKSPIVWSLMKYAVLGCTAVILVSLVSPEYLGIRYHYGLRGLILVIPVLLGGTAFLRRQGGSQSLLTRTAIISKIALGGMFYFVIWNTLITSQWSGYEAVVAHELSKNHRVVEFDKTDLVKESLGAQTISQFNHYWTIPYLSIVLQGIGSHHVGAIIDYPVSKLPTRPIEGIISTLPQLHYYGISNWTDTTQTVTNRP